jgi:hypothetical protein
MPFGQATVALPAYELAPAQARANTMFPTNPAASSSFVSSGTPMPGQNPAEGLTQAISETEAQYAAMLPTITTATPTSTDFILTLPGGSTFDVTQFFANYWWAVALGALVLFWPKGKGRR